MKLQQFLPLYLLLAGPILSLATCSRKKETTRGNELLRGSKECERARRQIFVLQKKFSFLSLRLPLSPPLLLLHNYSHCTPAVLAGWHAEIRDDVYVYIFSHFHKVGVRRTVFLFFCAQPFHLSSSLCCSQIPLCFCFSGQKRLASSPICVFGGNEWIEDLIPDVVFLAERVQIFTSPLLPYLFIHLLGFHR